MFIVADLVSLKRVMNNAVMSRLAPYDVIRIPRHRDVKLMSASREPHPAST